MTTAPVLEGLEHRLSGKVRDIYEVDEEHLLLVATDRISAFDVVLDDPIPGRGEVLTALTQFWLERTADLVPNHLVGWRASELPPGARQLAGRAMLVRRLEMIPFECIARGYLVGSGWKEYRSGGTVCGIPLPEGLREADRLPEPLFTPSTKALSGHDENVSEQVVAKRLGAELAGRLLGAGIVAAVVRQAVRPGLAGDHRLGQDPARAAPARRGRRRHRRPLPRGLRAPLRPLHRRLARRGQDVVAPGRRQGWPRTQRPGPAPPTARRSPALPQERR